MSSWTSAKARRVFAALHDSEELGPALLAKNLQEDGPPTTRPVIVLPSPHLGASRGFRSKTGINPIGRYEIAFGSFNGPLGNCRIRALRANSPDLGCCRNYP